MLVVIKNELTRPVDETIYVKMLLPVPRSLYIEYDVIELPPLLGVIQEMEMLVGDCVTI